MPFSLGVDIGSTYTAAALWRDGSVQSVPLGNRSNAVPSVLFLREDGTLLVGEAATRRAVVEPDRQARDFKRRMGDEVPILLGGDQRMTAHELTGHLLRWVIDTVAEREGERPDHVVLTPRAEGGDYRRDLLVEAAATAGLPDVGLLPEPVAAAAWYAAQDRVAPGALVGVYDLGGGTFDASVVRKTETGFEVFGEPGGDETIGGLNFDHTPLRDVGAAAGGGLGALEDTHPAIAARPGQVPGAPGGAGPTVGVPPVAPAPEAPAGAPPVVHPVNLAATGLTAPPDVTIAIGPPRVDIPRPRVTDRDEPVVVRTGAAGSGYWGRGVLTAAVVVAVVAAVVAGVAALAGRGSDRPPAGSPPPPVVTGGSRPGPAAPAAPPPP